MTKNQRDAKQANERDQHAAFIRAARTLHANETEENFAGKLRVIARAKPTKRAKEK